MTTTNPDCQQTSGTDLDVTVLAEARLDGCGRDWYARSFDDVFAPAYDIDHAVFVNHCSVARDKPSRSPVVIK